MRFVEPAIFGVEREPVERQVMVPSKWICTAKRVSVIGGFQVILGNKMLLYEPAADPHKGFVAGIWRYVAAVRRTENRVVVKYDYTRRRHVSEAILLSGRCSPNYYHWLIEYLGKAHLIVLDQGLRGIPLIVDADMHPQEFESLEAVLPGWPIIKVTSTELLTVDRLHIPSVGTYLPDNLNEPQWKGGALCFDMLRFLRHAVFNSLDITETRPHFRRRVFLARRTGRNILNSLEIEKLVQKHGIEVVDPTELSFSQQVQLFHDAELLIGAMGAGFTNLIFCRPGTRIITLCSPYTQKFCVQSNMALFAGADYILVVGEHPSYSEGDEDSVDDVNLFLDSYSVNAEKLEAALAVCALSPARNESRLGTTIGEIPGSITDLRRPGVAVPHISPEAVVSSPAVKHGGNA
jgi:capsular polysaccharide biosynthesis protein